MDKRKIILSSLIGTIALTAISLSASLAWYASSDKLEINTLDVDIVGERGIKISTSDDPSTFVDDLTKNDLTLPENDFLFAPVSSMCKNKWVEDKEKEMPIFYDCSYVSLTSEPNLEPKVDGFYQQKLYLMTDIDYYVTLDIDQCIFENDQNSNYARAEELVRELPELGLTTDEVYEKLNALIKCLRVSILVDGEDSRDYYIIDPTKSIGEYTVFGGTLDNSRNGYYDTFEVLDENDNQLEKEIVYGEVNDRSLVVYDNPVDPDGQSEEEYDYNGNKMFYGNSFSAKSKVNAYTFNKEASLTNGLEFAKEEALALDELRDNDTTKLLIPCYSNTPREIVLSIYLEGWDLDCVNATMGASFNTKLSFKLLRGI